MSGWEEDKGKSDVYLDEIKQILGLHLIGEPPIEEDQERNTDLMVVKMEAVRIACRVRNHSYLSAYHHEFTIRSSRPSGTKTEFQKIFDGWGDYMFYGFGEGKILTHWNLFDLDVFRKHVKEAVSEEVINNDQSSGFLPFVISDFPEKLIIANKNFFTTPVLQGMISGHPVAMWKDDLKKIVNPEQRKRVRDHLLTVYKVRNNGAIAGAV